MWHNGWVKKVKLIGILGLLVIFLVIIFQNQEVVDTRLLFATVSMPRAALLGITLLIGIVIGITSAMVFTSRGSKKNKPSDKSN